MKSIIDYIQECGEGCATPANTMGMGNPMVPGVAAAPGQLGSPGSEPINGKSKPKREKKYKKVQEGILNQDFDDRVNDDMKSAIIGWVAKVGTEGQVKKITVDDDLGIIADRFYMEIEKGETIPSYIKFKKINKLDLECEGNLVMPDGFLPQSVEIIDIYSNSKTPTTIKFENKELEVERCKISGSIIDVEFPKKFKAEFMDLSNCRDLTDVKNLQGIKKINFPADTCAILLRKHFGIKGEIQINGFGPY